MTHECQSDGIEDMEPIPSFFPREHAQISRQKRILRDHGFRNGLLRFRIPAKKRFNRWRGVAVDPQTLPPAPVLDLERELRETLTLQRLSVERLFYSENRW